MLWQAWNTRWNLYLHIITKALIGKREHFTMKWWMDTYPSMYMCNQMFFYKCHLSILWPRDYLVLSEFTLALLEDTGWYKANYTALHSIKQNPLRWGKGEDWVYVYLIHNLMRIFTTGLGCPFLTESCHNESAFPYLCNTSQTQLHCTYDHLTKVHSCVMHTYYHYVYYACY